MDSPIATLVAAASEAAAQIARRVLGAILELRSEERAQLVETVEVWFAIGGPADATGARLFCHPDTVRHRLRRVAENAGRDLRDPTAPAKLSAALHSVRLLPDLL